MQQESQAVPSQQVIALFQLLPVVKGGTFSNLQLLNED